LSILLVATARGAINTFLNKVSLRIKFCWEIGYPEKETDEVCRVCTTNPMLQVLKIFSLSLKNGFKKQGNN
jgi:hypothetical protein